MTSISIQALKEMKIGEVCELVKQAERLPVSTIYGGGCPEYNNSKTQTTQQIIDEIEGGGE